MVLINIDTSKDSHEDIRKTIRYLQALIGEETAQPASSVAPSSPSVAAEPMPEFMGMMGIFDAEEGRDATVQGPQASSKPAAQSLLEDDSIDDDRDVEVVDEGKDIYIEIVDYD